MASTKKEFIARTQYHHSKRTSDHVTLLAYKDSGGAYELLDDREPELEFLAGSKELLEDGFQRDNMTGDNEWQKFIS